MSEFTYPILFGILIGTILRIMMLRTDYRQYPTYLHGKTIHISLGFIAAALGSLVIPALLSKDYTAVTILTVAATQFREVRNMERNTLNEVDSYELVSRGKTYIEGTAISFESRNYLVMITSFIVTSVYIFTNFIFAALATILCFILSKIIKSGSVLKEIVNIEYKELHFDGAGLYVDNIYIMNIGLPERHEDIKKYGMGFVLTPKDINTITTVSNLGQRQAILHDVSIALGVFRDSGTPALTPLIKRDLDDGRLGVFVLPQIRDIDKAIEIIGQVPVLESAIRMPTKSKSHNEEVPANDD
jgi:uncharacterized protein